MSIQEMQDRKKDESCKDCNDDKNLTQKSINKERVKICDILYETEGKTFGLQEKFKGEQTILHEKKCLFKKTQENYHRYRNLDILVGTELLQTNESVKANVTTFAKTNKDLSAALKNIAKSIKDVKTKFDELKQAADKLDSCKDDSCNAAQWRALTGRSPGCNPEKPIEECTNAHQIFTELICRPKGLAKDIDSIFNAAHNVVGIQMFTSIDMLEPLQKTLDEQSKSFGKHINEVAKVRSEELKKLQEDLVKSVQEITRTAVDRNQERSSFEGYHEATKFLCCPPCDCVGDDWQPKGEYNPDNKDFCKQIGIPLLGTCESGITQICKDVKKGFCCPPPPEKPPGKEPKEASAY